MSGAFTAAPTKEDPVNQIPHAAPTIDKPRPNATPKLANPYGDIWVRTSAHPALQNSDVQVAEEDIVGSIGIFLFFIDFLLLRFASKLMIASGPCAWLVRAAADFSAVVFFF